MSAMCQAVFWTLGSMKSDKHTHTHTSSALVEFTIKQRETGDK